MLTPSCPLTGAEPMMHFQPAKEALYLYVEGQYLLNDNPSEVSCECRRPWQGQTRKSAAHYADSHDDKSLFAPACM
jgi:hypothetical protein